MRPGARNRPASTETAAVLNRAKPNFRRSSTLLNRLLAAQPTQQISQTTHSHKTVVTQPRNVLHHTNHKILYTHT